MFTKGIQQINNRKNRLWLSNSEKRRYQLVNSVSILTIGTVNSDSMSF